MILPGLIACCRVASENPSRCCIGSGSFARVYFPACMRKREKMSDCHVVVVNWNGGESAVQCALSVVQQSAQPTLWVVDNGSSDGSCDAIERRCPGVRLIRNERNLGYAAANNQALRGYMNVRYILLLNNDAVLPDATSLEAAVLYLADHPEVHGVCGRYEY